MPTPTQNEHTLLSKYYTEEEVAQFLNKTINSLRADASRRKGAPRTVIGKRVLYNKNSFEAWILEKEVLKNRKKKVLDRQNLCIYSRLIFIKRISIRIDVGLFFTLGNF